MSLPTISPKSGEVELPGGHKVQIKALSRADAMRMTSFGDDTAALEVDLIATSTGESVDATREWYQQAPSEAVQGLVEGILELNGMSGDLGNG